MRIRIPQLANGRVKTRPTSKKEHKVFMWSEERPDKMSTLCKQNYFLFSRIKELERTLDLFLIIMVLT